MSSTCAAGRGDTRERILYLRPDTAGEKRYILHSPPSRVILSEEGFGVPPLEYITDRAPFQHGDNVRSFHLNPRVIQLVTLQNFRNREEYWNGRAQLVEMLRPNALQPGTNPNFFIPNDIISALAPSRQGKLLCYLGNGKKRQLDVLLESGPGFAPPQGGWRAWSFTEVLRFVAHDPTWYDPTSKGVGLTNTEPSQLIFPVTFPVTFSTSSASGTVTYLGDWRSLPILVAWGAITAPSFTNLATGKKVGITTTIPADYAVVFDLQNKRVVRSDGLNLLGFLTDDSDLTEFAIEPDPIASGGVNPIVLEGTAFNPFAGPPLVQYYDRYLGI